MTTPTSAELALLKTQPQQTKLYLSIFQPQTVLTARVNDGSAAKGDRVITYDGASGDFNDVTGGMTMYVGTTAGGKEKGEIWIRKTPTATEITVGENSHINWEDDDYLTIVNFYQIWPVYPRYEQDGENITVYKFYDIGYVDENEDLGSMVVAGSHFAGFIDASTGTAQVYWDASESENVIGVTGSTYSWVFEGGTPSSSSDETPGWVTYDTPGHYYTLLTITEPNGGNEDYAARQVSIYDRPGVGANNPILQWGMNEFSGGREEGGYTARLWAKQNVESVVDGALVILFADDTYGDTVASIGGNSAQREKIVFAGYIIDGSIEYDYKTSTVSFDVGSPTEIMKVGESFSVSVEDSNDPSSDATTKGGDPWFYLKGLSAKTALYHYYRWHSTAASVVDMKYVGNDFDIQFFDADRTSLFDAANTFLKSALFGEMVSDRQGTIYFEISAEAIDDAQSNLNQSMFIDNNDWMGAPSIVEKYTDELAYLEGGGVSYNNYLNAGDGTFTALMGAAPGEVPGYRGTNIKASGLALSSQNQLNTLLGNVWENRNANFPEVILDLVGNYRNLDIAPQEIVTLTVQESDTFRGISWEQKAFTPRTMSWNYDAEKGTFFPTVILKEITQGNAGETIAIPVTPPSGGYDQPPIPLPPPVPPLPSLPIGALGYGFFISPSLGGRDSSGNPQHWGTQGGNKAGVETQSGDGGIAWGFTGAPDGSTQVIAYPIIANNSGTDDTVETRFKLWIYHIGSTGSDEFDQVIQDYTYGSGDLEWVSTHAVTLTVEPGSGVLWQVEINDVNDLAVWGSLMLFT